MKKQAEGRSNNETACNATSVFQVAGKYDSALHLVQKRYWIFGYITSGQIDMLSGWIEANVFKILFERASILVNYLKHNTYNVEN